MTGVAVCQDQYVPELQIETGLDVSDAENMVTLQIIVKH